MKVKILYVKGKGNLDIERVVLEVLQRTEIGHYLLCDTTYNKDGSVSNLLRHIYWFPDKVVEEGDYVVLYSKIGREGQFTNKAKTVTHKFYWGLDKTIWNKAGDGAVVFDINDWTSKGLIKD